MAASVKLPTDFGTTDRLGALRLQLMAGELASRIGARIREAREDSGINQRQLADRIPSDAVNNQRVSDWERGVNKPSDRYMKMIATALDRPVGWFYSEAPADTPDLMETLNGNGPSQLDRIEEKLDGLLEELNRTVAARDEALAGLRGQMAALDDQLRLMSARQATAAAEVLKRTEEALSATARSRR
jgi:transcriptional regulator with XRE-family HTH domain